MSHVLSLGAINTLTGEYVYPRIANKKDKYHCPECEKELILVKGEIRVHHFRHKKDDNPCNHYSHPTESQVHKDAKKILKSLLENKISIQFVRSCVCCRKNQVFEIPEMGKSSVIELEHRFEHNNGLKIADVGYLDEDEIVCFFEIYHTHKTRSEDRPEPWFEIDAETLINIANENKNPVFEIPCIRDEKCQECIDLQEIRRIEALEKRLKALEEAKESKELKLMREEELHMRNYEKEKKGRIEALERRMKEIEDVKRMKELHKMREEELHMRNCEKLEKSKKNYEIRQKQMREYEDKMNAEYEERKRECEERKRMSVEDPINIMIKLVMENKEKKKYIKKMRESEERERMSVEDPINIMRKLVMENKEKKKYIKIIKKDDERKRESEERERMNVEDPIFIKMIQDEKKQREKINAKCEEIIREIEERERMSVEDPIFIKMIQDEKKQREKMNAEYETKKQEHIQKIIEKEKKQRIEKAKRRLKLVESNKKRSQNCR